MDGIARDLLAARIPEIQIRYTPDDLPAKERPKVNVSADSYALLKPFFMPHMYIQEAFRVMLLDRGNRVKGIYTAGTGGLAGVVADPKLIFSVALRTLSCAIIVAHNHPSGQLRASEEDIQLTRKLVDAGRFLDILVHDHLIITEHGYLSFTDQGML